jgi:hypothetical protein
MSSDDSEVLMSLVGHQRGEEEKKIITLVVRKTAKTQAREGVSTDYRHKPRKMYILLKNQLRCGNVFLRALRVSCRISLSEIMISLSANTC